MNYEVVLFDLDGTLIDPKEGITKSVQYALEKMNVIVGSELDGTRTLKAEVIEEALRQLGNPSVEKCIMIGDRKYDIIGAQANKMASVGVEYGYGSAEELHSANATFVVGTVTKLRDVLVK